MSSGGGGNSGGTSTTVSKTEVPEEVKPYLSPYIQRGMDLSNQGYQPYGGQRIAPLTGEHNAALNMTANRAMSGSPLLGAAQQNTYDTLNGAYLDPTKNPAFAKGVENINATLSPSFGHMQAFGGNTAYGLNKARMTGDFAASIYNNERTNQQRSAAMAPQLAETDYRDAQALLGVGDIRREANQDQLNLGYQDFQAQQQWPYQQVGFAGDVLSRAMGGGGTQTMTGPNPYQPNRTAGALGGAALGYGMSSMIPALGPYGIPLALGGGLLGMSL